MIRLGIVGCNYGRTVQLPAFRLDPRCRVVALAGSDPARTAELARQSDIPGAYGDWRKMIEQEAIDAVAIATPPRLQPEIATAALKRGKAVFLEKPLAVNLAEAKSVLEQARVSGRPVIVDFEFLELPAWRRARALIGDGALGALRHVVVTWNVETHATRMRLKNWKTLGGDGGGALGNLASHTFYYLEQFCGTISGVSARLSGLPDAGDQSTVSMSLAFQSGAAGSVAISQASYLGSGHRLEFYGEDGTLALLNPTGDYMRGFELWHARRPAQSLERIHVEDPDSDRHPDGRIAPVARLAARFLDAIEGGPPAKPGIAEAFRVQSLIGLAHLSHQLDSKSAPATGQALEA